MILFFQIIFALCLFGIFQTYIFYPLFMILFSKIKNWKIEDDLREYPNVEIIFAAYNEESVIEKKIHSCFNSNYPKEKISLRIGSDNSTDASETIIQKLQGHYPNLNLKSFKSRTGKSGIINDLVKESKAEILILTDANIIFKANTIEELIRPLNNKVGAVGGRIVYDKHQSSGISKQEDSYLQLENKIKSAESLLFKAAMGLEGGCYAIKRELFPQIPPRFFMEDFFVSLSVIEKGYQVLFNSHAICFEDVSTDKNEEFKRKVRISIGNFQNLGRFKGLIIKRFKPIGFSFLSHKILRWLTPFFLILLLLSSLILSKDSLFFQSFSGLYFLFIVLGTLGILFSQNKSIGLLKYPGHFIHMNLALLKGFFIYLKGVKSNVWQPTNRNQN
tara:strand:- start:89986 stop:91152 length:1167 start_codon:yes stop_codon:yes gene_type:complete